MSEIKSPVKAIRQFCLDCCGGSSADVKSCTSVNCALKPFRFGKNPFLHREMTEEQKAAAAERLKAINAKGHAV